jgi:hypothetical protein
VPLAEPENAVLIDSARVVRWTGPIFGPVLGDLAAMDLLGRGISAFPPGLPELRHRVGRLRCHVARRPRRYCVLRAAPVPVPVYCRHRHRLLVVDARFDVLTTPSGQRFQSILLAVAVELPLPSVCLWLSYHTQQLAERRIVLLLRRQRPTSGGRAGSHDLHPAARGR